MIKNVIKFTVMKARISSLSSLIVFSLLIIACTDKSKIQNDTAPIEDTMMIKQLLELENPYAPRNPELAINYNKQAIELSEQIGFDKGYVLGAINLGRIYLHQKNYIQAENYFELGLKHSKSKNMTEYIPTCLGGLGVVHERQSDYKKSLDYYFKSREAFLTNKDSIGLIKCQMNISNVYNNIGSIAQAMRFILDGLEIAELIEDEYYIGTCLNNLGILYQEIGDNSIALPYFIRYLEISKARQDSMGMALAYNNIGASYQKINQNELALSNLIQSLEIRKQIGDISNISGILLNVGQVEFQEKDYKEALSYFSEALQIAEEYNDNLLIGKLSKLMGDTYVKLHQFNRASDFYNKSLQIAETYNINEMKLEALAAMTQTTAEAGNFEQAFRLSQQYRAFYDTVLQMRNSQVVAEMQVSYETKIKEDEIIQLKNEKENARIIRILLLSFAALLLIFAVYIYISQRLKYKRSKEIAHFQQALVERRLTIAELKRENLTQSLEHSKNEVTNLALSLMQRVEFSENLQKLIKKLQRTNNVSKDEMLKQINELLITNLRTDKEHANFQLYLENINSLFYKNLKEKFPDITEKEMKLSALLRCDFSSKEIAIIEGISPSSVDMARYRLRKKLGLSVNENLNSYLKEI